MELIKQHMCTIVKKKNDMKEAMERERDNMPMEAINRTEAFIENKGVV